MSAPIDLARHWTIDDLPDDGNRYEVVDGNLVVSPPPAHAHRWRASDLPDQLMQQARGGWRLTLGMSVSLGEDFRIPDLVVHRWPLTTDDDHGPYPVVATDTGLALEVVSPRSRKTDRFLKPAEYAEAGIPVFWRLETEPELVLHPFVLEDGAYAARTPVTATGTGTAPAPWDQVEVDLTQLP